MSSCLFSSYSSATIDVGAALLFLNEPLGLELRLALDTTFLDVLCVVPSRATTFGWGFDAESAIMVGRSFLEAVEESL